MSPAELAAKKSGEGAGKKSEVVAPLSPAEAAAGQKSEPAAPLSPAELAEKEKAAANAAADEGPVDPSAIKLKEPPPKTIGEGFEKRTLRRLTPEEKAARRAQWNLIMALIGVILLIGVAAILMQM